MTFRLICIDNTAGVQSLCRRFHPESQGSSRRIECHHESGNVCVSQTWSRRTQYFWLFLWSWQATNAASQSSSCWRHICEELCLTIGCMTWEFWASNETDILKLTSEKFWKCLRRERRVELGSYSREKIKADIFQWDNVSIRYKYRPT